MAMASGSMPYARLCWGPPIRLTTFHDPCRSGHPSAVFVGVTTLAGSAFRCGDQLSCADGVENMATTNAIAASATNVGALISHLAWCPTPLRLLRRRRSIRTRAVLEPYPFADRVACS